MANSVKHIRTANRSLVLNTIMQRGEMTIEDIMRTSGLSRPTVVGIVNGLISDRLLAKAGLAQAEVGRQPALFTINTSSHFAIGVDLDFPPVRIAISDFSGNQIYYDCWEMAADADIVAVADTIAAHIEQAFHNLKLDPECCLGIGLGVPSINDTRAGRNISVSRIKGWGSINLGQYISDKLDVDVFVRNDAQLIGMRENSMMGDPTSYFLFVLWRTGIGLSIFMHGNLYEGTYGNCGQLSHQVINAFSDKQCYCGSHGCLELYASRKAIVEEYKKRTGQNEDIQAEEIFERGEHGEAIAQEVLERAGMALGTALSSVAKMLDIPTIIISGLPCDEQNPFWTQMQEVLHQNTAHSLVEEPNLKKSVLPIESYGMGGCHFVLKNYFDVPELQTSME